MKTIYIPLLLIALAGCSKAPEYHDPQYYTDHQDEAIKVIKYCKGLDEDYIKTLQKNKNCMSAAWAMEQSQMNKMIASQPK